MSLTFLSLALVVGLINPTSNSFSSQNAEQHLKLYSEHEETGHDNIADSEHTHSHKHSEGGDEHEHSHDHLNLNFNPLIILNHFSIKTLSKTSTALEIFFMNQNLTSTEHPSSIFRPPIYLV